MWIILYGHIIRLLSLLTLEEEEEEEEEEYYSSDIPSTKEELGNWWGKFYSQHPYPLYAVVLGSTADQEIVSLVENHRSELAQLSGNSCCFVYFRHTDAAKNSQPFLFSEHFQWVYPLVKLVDIEYDALPCILFFEHIDSGEYVYITVKDKSHQGIIHVLRETFQYIRKTNQAQPLNTLRRYKRAKILSLKGRVLLENIVQVGRETLIELIKSATVGP